MIAFVLVLPISYNRTTDLIEVTKNKMALNLNIPVLQDNPVFIAETRPQKIQQSLMDLKAENPADIAIHIHAELETLNHQKISPSLRLQALDSYRPFVISIAQALAEDYIHSTLPFQDKAKVAAIATESLWLELGYGYKLALIDLQNQLIKLGTDKSSAHAIHHAIHAISEHAIVLYQTYLIPPNDIWSDLHQLYFCAVQLGIQNVETGVEKYEALTSAPVLTTIEDAYKHVLLMSLAEPQQLIQQEIKLISAYLTHHIKHALISAVVPLENPSGAFVISLSSDNPPVPYNKQKSAPNPDSDILLQTIDLVFIIHQDLKDLQNRQLPKNGSIPANVNHNDYIELLTHLIKNWGISPKRIFNRSPKNGDIELVTGIAAIHRVSNAIPPTPDATNNQLIAELNTLNITQTMPSRWKILNISATGMSIRRHHTAEKNISVGALISIKTKNEPHWSIGFVRWANCGTRDRLDIGVQLIAPQAHGAIARIQHHNNDELILLLPEITAVKQAATIVAPRGTYDPARQLTVTYHNSTKQVILTKLVERTHFVERMQYSIIG